MTDAASHPYLWGTLIAAAVLTGAAMIMREHKGTTFFSGLMLTPAVGLAVTYADYWTPARLGENLLGPADILYCYSAGLLTWLFALVLPFTRRLRTAWDIRSGTRRAMAVGASVTAPYLVFLLAGLDSMTATLIAFAIGVCFVLSARRDLWPLALPAAIGYPIAHCLALALAFRIWPELTSYWHKDLLWGRPFLLNVPLGEYVFHAALGAIWPLVVAFTLDLRPARANAASKVAPGLPPPQDFGRRLGSDPKRWNQGCNETNQQ